jgi:hypothetical protein
MLDMLDESSLQQLAVALSGLYSLTLCNGTVRVLCRGLPGRSVCAITHVDSMTYIVIDLDKPAAIRTAWNMVREWRESLVEPVVKDGHVELVPLSPLPTCDTPTQMSLG